MRERSPPWLSAQIAYGHANRRIVVQCKCYSRPIGSPELRNFIGCFVEHRPDEAWFVTNSTFTREALHFAHQDRVLMVDRAELESWMHKALAWGEGRSGAANRQALG